MSESNIPNLKTQRVMRGLTQADIAKEIGVDARTVLRWENGDNDPKIKDMRKLAAYFGVTVAYLIGDEPTGPRGWDALEDPARGLGSSADC